MTVVKVCGITNEDDALSAVDAGADMLGFIFHRKSPRYISPQAVHEIVQVVRSRDRQVVLVGVFVNEAAPAILEIMESTGVDLVQLHGDEPPGMLKTLDGRGYKAVRSMSDAQAYLLDPLQNTQRPMAPDLLLDADHPTLYGGSGLRADESIAVQLAGRCRLLLAGGLSPENVSSAIAHVHPWGVDVSSGVERIPGHKDHDKVRLFIQNAHRAV